VISTKHYTQNKEQQTHHITTLHSIFACSQALLGLSDGGTLSMHFKPSSNESDNPVVAALF
jgi:hypothetical protein